MEMATTNAPIMIMPLTLVIVSKGSDQSRIPALPAVKWRAGKPPALSFCLNLMNSDKYNEMVRCMKDVAVVCAMSINSKMDEESIRLEDGIERLLNDELNLKKVQRNWSITFHTFWQLFIRRLCSYS